MIDTDLKRSVVGDVASQYVDILDVRDSRVQVRGPCWITDDCEDDGVGSAGLKDQEDWVAIICRNQVETHQLTNILEADAPGCAYYNVRGHGE